MRSPLWAALLIGAALSLPTASAQTTYCPVQVIPDYVLGFAYRALLRLDPACPPGGVGRVRKVSTLNSYGPFVPQKPGGLPQYGGVWGWNLTAISSSVPSRELWTTLHWEWNYWDGTDWLPAEGP
ncbi:hypothetical protein [Deinococcus apachensis]|uniref:hypothetical protein n=1 Tax=Deinococcus apachensis TaxID=309886 RepID=UPI00036C336C|nr:hypothetical protein [Deinococcus apachensis]